MAKCVKTRCIQEGVDHLQPRFQGEGVVPGEYFLVSAKLKTQFAIRRCKLHRATCRRFDTIPACDGLTDGQTDGIAVASTALVTRRAVKSRPDVQKSLFCSLILRAEQNITKKLTF